MKLKTQNGKNLIQFKDLGTQFGQLITKRFLCMEDLKMKLQTFLPIQFWNSIWLLMLKEMQIYYKNLKALFRMHLRMANLEPVLQKVQMDQVTVQTQELQLPLCRV